MSSSYVGQDRRHNIKGSVAIGEPNFGSRGIWPIVGCQEIVAMIPIKIRNRYSGLRPKNEAGVRHRLWRCKCRRRH